jgi:hypothetical protein
MPTGADTEMTKMVKREITKRPIDSSRLDAYCMHGVVYLRGVVGALRGHNSDVKDEMDKAKRAIRQKAGVREIIDEVNYPRL